MTLYAPWLTHRVFTRSANRSLRYLRLRESLNGLYRLRRCELRSHRHSYGRDAFCARSLGSHLSALWTSAPLEVALRCLQKRPVLRTNDGHRDATALILDLRVIILVTMHLTTTLEKATLAIRPHPTSALRTSLSLPMVRRQLPKRTMFGTNDLDFRVLIHILSARIIVLVTVHITATCDKILLRHPTLPRTL